MCFGGGGNYQPPPTPPPPPKDTPSPAGKDAEQRFQQARAGMATTMESDLELNPAKGATVLGSTK